MAANNKNAQFRLNTTEKIINAMSSRRNSNMMILKQEQEVEDDAENKAEDHFDEDEH